MPASRRRAGTLILTIIAGNYAAHARTLMASLAIQLPEADRVVLLVDRHDAAAMGEMPARVVFAEEMGIPRFREMAFWYDVMELATAIKAFALSRGFELKPREMNQVQFLRTVVPGIAELGMGLITDFYHYKPTTRIKLLAEGFEW